MEISIIYYCGVTICFMNVLIVISLSNTSVGLHLCNVINIDSILYQ